MVFTYEAASFRRGRTTVMGIATLLIVWFHSAILADSESFLGRLKFISDIGVDMFLFASGAGVYFAVKKHGSFWPYLQSRMSRVLLPYLIVAVPWFAYQDIILGGSRRLFVKDLTFLTFWQDGLMTFWYIAAILVFYIATPLYMKLWERFRNLDKVCLCTVYGVIFLIVVGNLYSMVGTAIILLQRLPVYLVGLSFGRAMQENRVFRIRAVWPVLTLAVCSFILAAAVGWLPWQLPFIFKSLAFGPTAVILSTACAKLPVNRFTEYFGQRSLEIYLLLEKIQVTLGNRREMEPFMNINGIPFFILAFAITLVLTECLRWMTLLLRRGFAAGWRIDIFR